LINIKKVACFCIFIILIAFISFAVKKYALEDNKKPKYGTMVKRIDMYEL